VLAVSGNGELSGQDRREDDHTCGLCPGMCTRTSSLFKHGSSSANICSCTYPRIANHAKILVCGLKCGCNLQAYVHTSRHVPKQAYCMQAHPLGRKGRPRLAMICTRVKSELPAAQQLPPTHGRQIACCAHCQQELSKPFISICGRPKYEALLRASNRLTSRYKYSLPHARFTLAATSSSSTLCHATPVVRTCAKECSYIATHVQRSAATL